MGFNQKECVYFAVKSYLKEKGVDHTDGELVELDKIGRKTVIELVTQSAMSGEMEVSAEARVKYATTELMRGYVNGLVSNWLRKDLRLNGNTKYEAKNPGSRAGSGDEVLKNLKALRSTLTEADHIKAVDAEIESRKSEIAATKAKAVEVDMSKIPDSLKALLKI